MTVKVTIDGKALEVERGVMALDAARRVGIDIPTLCHHEALSAYGACRLCLVEVGAGGRTRITTSCNYPLLREGESVSTSSERVLTARRVVMELMLARCPEVPRVREVARRIGVTESRFPAPTPSRLAAADAALANCILCGMCVRACEEAIGASAISFADRGPNRRVAAPFYVSAAACIGCGACASVCPTGLIRIEDSDGVRRLPFLATEVPLAKCERCGGPIAPTPQRDLLAAKAPAVKEQLRMCPACRRAGFGSELARESLRARGTTP